jgi:hypothetical protein
MVLGEFRPSHAQMLNLFAQASMKPRELLSVDPSVKRSRSSTMSMDRDPNVYDRETRVYDRDSRGSNTLAYLIGGLVLALGLLAFLFYDGGGSDVNTTSSTGTQTERPAGSTSPGATGSTGSSTAPTAPARPATPQQ